MLVRDKHATLVINAQLRQGPLRMKKPSNAATPAIDTTRLFVNEPLFEGVCLSLNEGQAHHVRTVLRMSEGEEVLLFNGQNGEWRAELSSVTKKGVLATGLEQTRKQTHLGRIHLGLAPLKHARQDYVVQKAVEMGAAVMTPLRTQRTHAPTLKPERFFANIVEAAEQCGVLSIPDVRPEQNLRAFLATWPAHQPLLVADEGAPIADPLAVLSSLKATEGSVGALIGPEGGWSPEERALFAAYPCVVTWSLGPRIMRADTAMVAAMALLQAVLGDWA